jgi:hypothetical protein
VRPLLALLLALLTPGCFAPSGASPNAVPMVRVHAEADLDCPGREIRITQKIGGRFEAVGCGHRAEYLTACDGLQCVVEDPGKSVPWRARPDPGSQMR